jgi:4-carboxymuconolactone decarboxylase
MMPDAVATATIGVADAPTLKLVRLSAIITNGAESDLRAAFTDVVNAVPTSWIEELVLQSYLFAGFPRGLTAAREWRRVSGHEPPVWDEGTDYDRADEWRDRGEETCAVVYGQRYEALRVNVRALHPALEAWMIVEGYGKVLSRPGLDLPRRELCVIASCAAARQDRQLHSHLHGALNAGASAGDISATLDAIADIIGEADSRRIRMLWARVMGK